MKRLIRSRKGLSPVLSTVLMILVAITGMSLLFAFFVNYARDFQLGSGSAVLESMVIEDVWFKDATQAEVSVYNVGKVSLTITSVYIDDQFAGSPNIEIPTGQHRMVPVTWNFEHGNDYIFKMVTTRGSVFEGSNSW